MNHPNLTFPGVDGWLTDSDRDDLCRLAQATANVPGHVVEIGSHQGLSALCILSGMAPDKILYCYDYFEQPKYIRFRQNTTPHQSQIIAHRGDFRQNRFFQPTPTQISFAFIDHDHRLDTTRDAYEWLWAILSPGGCILFHDYNHPDYPEPKPFLDSLPHPFKPQRHGMAGFYKPPL